MGRAPCCDKANVKKGPWSPEEDAKLKDFIEKHGTAGNWIALPQKAGLKRCGKSCRLRWLNYLRPNLKHGEFSDDEDRIICSLFASIGSRWSVIASQLPGRTDNDIKNYWNTKLKKKLLGISTPKTHHQQHQQSIFPNFSFNTTTPQDFGFLHPSQQMFSTSSSQELKNFNALIKDNANNNSRSFLAFSNRDHQQQSCSSSDASYSTQFMKELDLEYPDGAAAAAIVEQLVIDSFLISNGQENQNNQVVDAPSIAPLEYSSEETRQLLLQQQHYHNPNVDPTRYSFYH